MLASYLLVAILNLFALSPRCVSTQQRSDTVRDDVLNGKTTFLKEFLKASEELFPFSHSARNVSKNEVDYEKSNDKPQNNPPKPAAAGVFKRKVPDRNQLNLNDYIQPTAKPAPSLNFSLNQFDQATRLFIQTILRNANKRADSRLITNALDSGSDTGHGSHSSQTQLGGRKRSPGTATVPSNKNSDGKDKTSFLGLFVRTLTDLPIIGNILRASVDPLYRPIVKSIQSRTQTGDILQDANENVEDWCFGSLGCLPLTADFFHPLYRPVNLPPYQRKDINVAFAIHTAIDPDGHLVYASNISGIWNSTFSESVPTKIIVHGFLHDRHQTWVGEMVRGFLIHGNYNVITGDWSKGSRALYSQATANARVVAMEIVNLISWLKNNYNASTSSMHIIGHSLGAHIAGYVGEAADGLERITGLDPAEPYFQYMPIAVRLDPSDAKFVDVIHTDIDSFYAFTGPRGYGLQQPVGHVDFYPNGGHEQPGCNQLLTRVPLTMMLEGQDFAEGINAAQTELIQCDHIRSAKLFTDSLISNCPFLGYNCDTYKLYRDGQCFSCGPTGEYCFSMGIDADKWMLPNKTNLRIFLDTNTSPSFCLYHYVLRLETNDLQVPSGYLRGRIKITLISSDGALREFDLTELAPIKFPRKGMRSFLLETIEDLTGTSEALVSWTYESDLLDPLSFCMLFCRAELYIVSVTLQSVDTPEMAVKALRFQQKASAGLTSLRPPQVTMCQSEGKQTVTIPNGNTVKISANSGCHQISDSSKIPAPSNTTL